MYLIFQADLFVFHSSTYRDEKDADFNALLTHRFGDYDHGDVGEQTVIKDANTDPLLVPDVSPSDSDAVITGDVQIPAMGLGRSEVLNIPSPCPNCLEWGEARTAMTDIPHFKEVCLYVVSVHRCNLYTNFSS